MRGDNMSRGHVTKMEEGLIYITRNEIGTYGKERLDDRIGCLMRALPKELEKMGTWKDSWDQRVALGEFCDAYITKEYDLKEYGMEIVGGSYWVGGREFYHKYSAIYIKYGSITFVLSWKYPPEEEYTAFFINSLEVFGDL